MGRGKNPAVVAGLMGAGLVAWAVPARADALSLAQVQGAAAELLDAVTTTPELAFVAGVAAGAVAAGAVAGTVSAVRSHRRAQEDAVARGFAPARAEKDEPAPVAEPVRADAAPEATRREKPEPASAPAPAAGRHAARPRHLAPDASFESAPEPAPERASASAPGHAARDYEDIAENYVRRASFRDRMARRAQGVAATLSSRMDAGRMQGVPVIERADGSVGDVGTSWWHATAAAAAPAPAQDPGLSSENDALAIPSDFSAVTDRDLLASAAARLQERPAGGASASAQNAAPAAPRAAAPSPETTAPDFSAAPAAGPRQKASARGAIAARVATVDAPVFPEHRAAAEQEDVWDQALRSLEEQLADELPAASVPAFADTVGGIDTLDEPDGLEPSTAFIPFKTPAGHPEVVDTDSYVDYLIKEEFSKSSSTSARTSSRRFLRVLEGGTQPSAQTPAHNQPRRSGDSGPSRATRSARPKHFSAQVAAEA